MSAYADTSFLASLYLPESHSERAAYAMQKAELPFFLTPVGELELKNSFHLRVFRKEMKRTELRAVLADLQKDIASGIYFLKPLPGEVFDRALHLIRKRTVKLGSRTLDVLHVASALELRMKTFYTFDRQQAALARIAGLSVVS